jgi:hypothetical protein
MCYVVNITPLFSLLDLMEDHNFIPVMLFLSGNFVKGKFI